MRCILFFICLLSQISFAQKVDSTRAFQIALALIVVRAAFALHVLHVVLEITQHPRLVRCAGHHKVAREKQLVLGLIPPVLVVVCNKRKATA